MKTYTFTVTIEEGNDEFWDSLNGFTGIAAVKDWLEFHVNQDGIEPTVELTDFRADGGLGQPWGDDDGNPWTPAEYTEHWSYLKPEKPLIGDDRPWVWDKEDDKKA